MITQQAIAALTKEVNGVASWEPIGAAPKDGYEQTVACQSNGPLRFPYPLRAIYQDGAWKASFGENDWRPFDPQPTHFLKQQAV